MANLLKKLLQKLVCQHEWEKIVSSARYSSELSSYDYDVYLCKKCLKRKKIKH